MNDKIETVELAALLSNNPTLKAVLNPESIGMFCQYLSVSEFKAGEQIIKFGYPAVELNFILTGEASVSIDQVQVKVLSEQDIFGEGMFSDEGLRSADVFAKSDCIVASLNLWAYESMLFNDSDLALKIKKTFESLYEERQQINQAREHNEAPRYLALIAHDTMKESLNKFVNAHRDLVERFPLIATGMTGLELHHSTGLIFNRKVKSGHLGGYQAIGAMISEDDILGVIFFRDPHSATPADAAVSELSRLCDVYQIPFATNPASAAAILKELSADRSR
ncbi:methylglyoxal synthase [Myxococcota bacterium]|nr:methylglyoxal synthase [Myxococcota bacterium]MBU1429074.1 methylglyoxal synthase [Myxococcota bacterium]MBU1899862.1 methylglyoxal synthase [Myxococcota bacterium]